MGSCMVGSDRHGPCATTREWRLAWSTDVEGRPAWDPCMAYDKMHEFRFFEIFFYFEHDFGLYKKDRRLESSIAEGSHKSFLKRFLRVL